MRSVAEICELLNDQAATLAPDLLPNGRRAGDKWMASGIADTGRSESLYVHLSGEKIGKWFDMGNAAAGEDKGDMLDLLRLVRGFGSVSDALQEAKRMLGIHDTFMPNRPAPSQEDLDRRAAEARARAEKRETDEAETRALKARRAVALYLGGKTIAGTPAEAYLIGRGLASPDMIDFEWPGSLRFHAEVWHRDERVKLPAMLAPIYNAAGRQIGTHRTYLQHDQRRGWTKLAAPNAKMVLGNMWGGFVPINKGSSGKSMRSLPVGEAVYVTEGIEDALAVRLMKSAARIVSAISLPNIGGILLPEAARDLVIVADRDVSATAQDQLERSIGQQQARGLGVRLVMPPVGLKDMNDWLLAWRDAQVAA